jgi:hypothetical protein
MVEKGWRQSLTADAATKAALRARGLVGKAASSAAQGARAVGGTMGEAAGGVQDLALNISGPTVPFSTPWRTGLGELLSTHPQLPKGLVGVVRQLDRLGEIQLSPETLGFDGEQVPWSRIQQIAVGSAGDMLTSRALEQEIGRLTSRLPPVPGRRWLVSHVMEVLVALCLAAAVRSERDPGPTEETSAPRDGQRVVPVAVTYRGALRTRVLTPGVFATLVAASTPSVAEATISLARAHGVTITIAPPSPARERAATMREVAAGIHSLMSRTETSVDTRGEVDPLPTRPPSASGDKMPEQGDARDKQADQE